MKLYFAAMGTLWGTLFLTYAMWRRQGCRAFPWVSDLGHGDDALRVEMFRCGLILGSVFWILFIRQLRAAQLTLARTPDERKVVSASYVTGMIALVSIIGVALFPWKPGCEIPHIMFALIALNAGAASNVLHAKSTRAFHGPSSWPCRVQIILFIIFALLSVKSLSESPVILFTPFQVFVDRLTMTDFSTLCREGYLMDADGSDRIAPAAIAEWLLFGSISTFGFTLAKDLRASKRAD